MHLVHNLRPTCSAEQQAVEPMKSKQFTCTRIFKPVIIPLAHYMHPVAFAAFGGDCDVDPISFHATS